MPVIHKTFPVVMTIASAVALGSLLWPTAPLLLSDLPPRKREIKLPNELWHIILSYLPNSKDVLSVCRSSKRLRDIVEYQLYRVLNDENLWAEQQALLYRVIQVPRRAEIITEMKIQLKEVPNYAIPKDDPAYDSLRACSCRCDALDDQVGRALQCLKHLEILHIHCTLCEDASRNRHNYLSKLASTRLREFSFCCFCSTSKVTSRAVKTFGSPCMRPVTTLSWHFDPSGQYIPTSMVEGFKDPEILPNLTALDHDGSIIAAALLSSHKITRLSAELVPAPTKDQLQSKFTHLSVDDTDFELWGTKEIEWTPFLHVRHLGVIPFQDRTAEGALAGMQRFTPLTHLSSIQVALIHDAYDPWNEDLLTQVTDLHPYLCKVLVKGSKHNLWKLTEGGWKKRPIKAYKSWDLVKGVVDDL